MDKVVGGDAVLLVNDLSRVRVAEVHFGLGGREKEEND